MSAASVLFDAPGPRARLRNHVTAVAALLLVGLAAWFVVTKLSAAGQFEPAKWTPFLTGDLWVTYVIPGVENTLMAAAISIVLASILGSFLGVGRMSTHAVIRWPCAVFVEVFRAIPVLMLMIIAYSCYSHYAVFPSVYATLAGVVTGLTLYNGAVIAEIVRAGVQALPRGQTEAAWALGLRWGQTMRSILLPQAITSMLPVLVSQLVVVLKDTAIGVVITYVELLGEAQNIGAAYSNYIPALLVVAAIYIVVNSSLTSFAVRLEGRLRRSARGPAPLETDVEQDGAPGARIG